MKDTDIFTTGGYDMVVAVTQKSVNDQIAHLANPDIGTINTSLIIEMTFSDDGETMIPIIHQSWDEVDKTSKGVPLNPAINAQYMPSVNIASSGTSVEFTLTFLSGQSYMRNPISGVMMTPKDMTGWVYAIDIDLDFAGISRGDIEKGIAVPENVLKQLDSFTTDQFSVTSLFMNFQSTDLMRFNPVSTSVGTAGSSALSYFTAFMAEYLGAVSKDQANNPYILGYSITNTPQTIATPANELDTIPDSMKPVGNTFNVFQDTVNPDISTINFILNTKLSGGNQPPGVHSTPGNFDTSWISPSDQCDGKMVYSLFCFLETIILRPFYESYAQGTQDQVRKCLSISSSPNPWESAKSALASGDGLYFNAFNQTGTNDDYTNSYEVTWSSTPTGASINFSGTIFVKKTMVKDMLLCTAVAWKSSTLKWSGIIDLNYGFDKEQDKPSITTVGPLINIDSSTPGEWQNTCAQGWGTIGEIFGTFLDFFTAFQDGGFLANLFSDTTGIDHFSMPAINVALGSVSTASTNAFMLPAGDVFFFKNLSILPEGPISMEVTYKTATDNAGSPTALGATASAKKSPKDSNIQTISTDWSTKRALYNKNNVKPPAEPTKPKTTSIRFKSSSAVNGSGITAPNSTDQTSDNTDSTDFSQPLVDRFSLSPSTTSSLKDPIDVTVSCELMSNSEAAMPVAPNEDMIVVQDSGSQALIFTIGSDARFNLLAGTSAETTTGWTATNLLDNFANYASAVCFDAVQDSNGNISVAVALQQQGSSQIDTFFASLLSNDMSQTDFTKLSELAPLVQGVDPAFTPESIRLGSSDDGKRPMLTIEGSLNGKHLLYQMNAGDAKATLLELPEDMTPGKDSLIGQCTGFNFGQRGNYFLYNIGATRHLVVRTSGSQGTLNYDYSPGNAELPSQFQHLTYNCIQTATSRKGAMFTASDIYIGTPTGVYRIPNGKSGSMELVSDSVVDVHDIVVTISGDDISLWVTSSPDKLYYIYGHRTSATAITWNMPIIFASSVLRATTMRNLAKNSNELFVLTSDLAVWHYWQDPESTLWRSSKAIVQNDAYVLNFDSYTTHLHFESTGLPLLSQKVKITSSEWQYCTINGLKYSLDQDAPAEVEVDPSGNVTIIQPAGDISPPILHVQSDDFVETINIYTSGKVITNLKSVTDGPSLQSAKDQDGKLVMGSDVTADVASAVATNMSTLRDAVAAQYPPSLKGNTFVVVETPAASGNLKASAAVKNSLKTPMPTDHLPDNFAIGMKLEKGKWVQHTTKSAQDHLAAMSRLAVSWDDVSNFAGDIWHHLEQLGDEIITGLKDTAVFLADGISFIISKAGDVLQFVLTIGDKVLEIALETFVLVFKALSWVLSLVGIDLPGILRWLGHLMGWDKVWDTHVLIATTLTNFITYGDTIALEYLEKARASAKTFFQNMDQDMKEAILPKSMQTQTPVSAAVPPNGPDLSSPQSNYVAYHLNNTAASTTTAAQDSAANVEAVRLQSKPSTANGVPVKTKAKSTANGAPVTANGVPIKAKAKSTANGAPVTAKVMANGTTANDPATNPGEIAIDVLEQFANDIIMPMGKTLMDKLGTDLDDLIDLLKHGSMDKLWTLIADAADTVISVIAEFVDGFLKFCEDLVNDIKNLLTEPLEIPFFTELYKFICQLMGHEEDFTAVNVISFLISIPLTTMMKIGGYGTIMDHNDIIGMDDPGFPQKLVSTVQGALKSPQTPVSRAQSKVARPKALQTTHLLAASDDGFQPPVWLSYSSAVLGLINSVGAIIYNGLDFDFLVTKDADWKKKVKTYLAAARLFTSAPMPKANVDAQAYEVRWVAWVISNGWRIFINVVKPGNPPVPALAPPAINLPPFFENGGSLGVNVTAEVMAIVCDYRDDVSGLTWAGDVVSNTGSSFSSLGKMVEKDMEQPEVGKPMTIIATFVALGGNVCAFVNAGGTLVNAAEGKNMWNGIL